MALRYDRETELFYPAGAPGLDPGIDDIESAPELHRTIMFYWKNWESLVREVGMSNTSWELIATLIEMVGMWNG
jgi:hypothetical protein